MIRVYRDFMRDAALRYLAKRTKYMHFATTKTLATTFDDHNRRRRLFFAMDNVDDEDVWFGILLYGWEWETKGEEEWLHDNDSHTTQASTITTTIYIHTQP